MQGDKSNSGTSVSCCNDCKTGIDRVNSEVYKLL